MVIVVLYSFYLLLLILVTVSCTKNADNWIYRRCKHFFIASSRSPPTATSPVEDGKFSSLFD